MKLNFNRIFLFFLKKIFFKRFFYKIEIFCYHELKQKIIVIIYKITNFRKNEKLLECKANRSACHLALFNFRECIDDCNEVLNYIEKLPEGERETYNLMRTRLMSRKAVALSWEGSGLESAENIFQELRINPNLKEEISLQIVKAHELLQTRISSIPHKVNSNKIL